MGTEIFYFGTGRAEPFTFKDFNLIVKIQPQGTFYQENVHKNLNIQLLGVIWNHLVTSFLMCTGTL